MDFLRRSRLKVTSILLALLCLAMTNTLLFAQQPKSVPPKSVQPAGQLQKLLALGQEQVDQGRLDEALKTYSQAIGLASSDRRTLGTLNLRMGSIYLAQRKLNDAQAALQRSISFAPDMAEAHNYLGEVLGEMKQYSTAIESFNKALVLDPTLLRARYNMGVTYARMGNSKYSEFVFKNLIKNSPDYSLAYDGLAVTLSRAGRAKEAVPMHEKAISLAPQEPSYYYNLGISYLMLGETSKALEQQQKLQSIDPRVADQLASVIIKRRM